MLVLLTKGIVGLVIFSICLLMAFAYGALWIWLPVSHLRSFLKTGSVLGLAILAFLWDLPWWGVALAFGAAGDWFLSREHEVGFLPGLVLFTIGHCVYVALLWPLAGAAPLTGLIILGLMAGGLMLILWGRLGLFQIPVALYAALSFLLASFALGMPAEAQVLTIGILLFVISDVILAFELFVLKDKTVIKRIATISVWVLYWGGQSSILYGFAAYLA